MPSPKQGYYLKSGDKVPGTTTIIGRFKDSGALVQWAYKQGREHERLVWQGRPAPKSLYEKVEEAADIGTIVHSLIEKHIKMQPVNMEEFEKMDPRVKSSFDAYLQWERINGLKILETEMPLVSEEMRFGGTPDAIGRIGDELCLIDWKTSNRVYTDHIIQCAAYCYLVNEREGKEVVKTAHLCRFSKEHGDFSHHYFTGLLESPLAAFGHMRRLYDIDHELKRRAA